MSYITQPFEPISQIATISFQMSGAKSKPLDLSQRIQLDKHRLTNFAQAHIFYNKLNSLH